MRFAVGAKFPATSGNLFEPRPFCGVGREQRLAAKYARPLRFEKCAPLGGEESGTVGAPIEFQQQTPTRFEKSGANIANKKSPVLGGPFHPFAMLAARDSVKTNSVTGHEIEFAAEVG